MVSQRSKYYRGQIFKCVLNLFWVKGHRHDNIIKHRYDNIIKHRHDNIIKHRHDNIIKHRHDNIIKHRHDNIIKNHKKYDFKNLEQQNLFLFKCFRLNYAEILSLKICIKM